MILKIGKADLDDNVPSAISPDEDIFNLCLSFFSQAEDYLCQKYLGSKFLEYLVEQNKFESYLKRYVIFRGFALAVPELDLVLTENGFAIASTDQLAPASKERVQSMQKAIYARSLDIIGMLLDFISEDNALFSKWTELSERQVVTNIRHFFWHRTDIKDIFLPEDNAFEISAYFPMLTALNMQASRYVSSELLDELTEKSQQNTLTSEDIKLMDMLLAAYSSMAQTKMAPGIALDRAVGYIEKNLEHFTSYKESNVYLAKTIHGYENEKDSSIFYFG